MPAHDRLGDRVRRGEIGLDVQERRFVEAIEANHREPVPLHAHQARNAHGDWVWACGGAQRKGAASDSIVARHLDREIAPRPLHPIQHYYMCAALDALERRRPSGSDFDGAYGVGFARIFRTLLAIVPRRANAANEIKMRIEACGQADRRLALTDVGWAVRHLRS